MSMALDFLPLGADRNTAVYGATEGQTAYFVKLRWGDFDDITPLESRSCRTIPAWRR
ncbi:MAG: hypothetical protein IPK19_40160 [Chloroflexi bacterium]|nr:hypothetical protein [Chloroflexota bacterium]